MNVILQTQIRHLSMPRSNEYFTETLWLLCSMWHWGRQTPAMATQQPSFKKCFNIAPSKDDFPSIYQLITQALSQSKSPLALHWGDLEIKAESCCVLLCNNLTKHGQAHLEAFIRKTLEGCDTRRPVVLRTSSCFQLALPALEKWVNLFSGF